MVDPEACKFLTICIARLWRAPELELGPRDGALQSGAYAIAVSHAVVSCMFVK
jgi:hypothetical protein